MLTTDYLVQGSAKHGLQGKSSLVHLLTEGLLLPQIQSGQNKEHDRMVHGTENIYHLVRGRKGSLTSDLVQVPSF